MSQLTAEIDSAEIDGAALLTQVEAIYRRYVVMPSEHAYAACALWAAHTHCQAAFDYAPRLLFTSAEKQSGKTRALELTGHLAHRQLAVANSSTSFLFRSLEDPATVIFDEADTVFGTRAQAEHNEDLRGILNAGFQRGTSVGRTEGPLHQPTQFNVFAPAALAAIGDLPDTVNDRSVVIRMVRRRECEYISAWRHGRDKPAADELRQRLGEWLGPQSEKVRALPDNINPLDDRPADVWEPLLKVASLAGGIWPTKARAAAIALTNGKLEDNVSIWHELLYDCRQVLSNYKTDFISTTNLIALLTELEEGRWKEYGKNGLTGHSLARLLRYYGIMSQHRRVHGEPRRGYLLEDFEDAFERYLDPAPEAPPVLDDLKRHTGTFAV